MLNPRLTFVVILVILTAIQATAGSPDPESSIDVHFEEVHSNADTSGSGFLVGIPRPTSQPPNQLFWDLEGDDVQVETWTRYYRDLAGVSTQDPDRPDERTITDYGTASGALVDHEDDADMALVPSEEDQMTISTSFPTNRFDTRSSYIYHNDVFLPGELSEFHDFDPPDDPAWYHKAGQEENFQYIGSGDDDWIEAGNNFTLTFIYGGFDIHNETHTDHVEAKRKHIAGNPPVYEEYSITRAFIHVTNGTANIHPGGRTTQINLANFDIPDSSTLRFTNATGTWSQNEQEKSFSNANLQITGEGLGLLAEPYTRDENLLKKGEIHGSIEEVSINGRAVELTPGGATLNEPAPLPPLFFVAATMVALVVVLGYPGYRVLRRRQAEPFTRHASALFDEQDDEGAAYWAHKALRCEPRSTEAAAILTITALRSGEVDEAIICLERTRDEDDPLVRLLLAVALREAGEPNQARRMMRTLLKEHPHLYDLVTHTDLVVYDAAEDHDNLLDPGYA